MARRHLQTTTVAAVVAALAIGAGGGALAYAFLANDTTTVVRQVTVSGSAGQSQPADQTGALTVNQIYTRSQKGVVEITVTSTGSSQSPFGNSQQQAQGSGFVYDRNGDIVTNQHVVAGAGAISVRFSNGAVYKATLVGSDGSTDLAVIKVDAPESLIQPLPLGDSNKVQVGDGVVAIGSPFGLEETVTSGIVSALHRQMTAPNNFTINDSIQTDAAINHGNSGGPLLNTQAQVIGVNSQIESESGGSEGVGFAIPSNTVRSIVSQLVDTGRVEHAYLGVTIETIPASVAKQLGTVAGVEVTRVVNGTPAAKAGLKAASGSRTINGETYPTGGDVIVAFNGKTVSSSEALQNAVDAKQPGDSVSITYVRNGTRHTVQVTLANRPASVG
jgi:putative serine protease PepD